MTPEPLAAQPTPGEPTPKAAKPILDRKRPTEATLTAYPTAATFKRKKAPTKDVPQSMLAA